MLWGESETRGCEIGNEVRTLVHLDERRSRPLLTSRLVRAYISCAGLNGWIGAVSLQFSKSAHNLLLLAADLWRRGSDFGVRHAQPSALEGLANDLSHLRHLVDHGTLSF